MASVLLRLQSGQRSACADRCPNLVGWGETHPSSLIIDSLYLSIFIPFSIFFRICFDVTKLKADWQRLAGRVCVCLVKPLAH